MDFLTQMRAYFLAEKNKSLMFLLLGLATLTTAGFCWIVWKEPFYIGMAWPLAVISLLQIYGGGTVYWKMDEKIKLLETRFAENPGAFAERARAQIKVVLQNFVIQRWFEIATMAVGFALILIHSKADYWKGWGAGMFLQGGLLILGNYFTDKRARDYLENLDEIE